MNGRLRFRLNGAVLGGEVVAFLRRLDDGRWSAKLNRADEPTGVGPTKREAVRSAMRSGLMTADRARSVRLHEWSDDRLWRAAKTGLASDRWLRAALFAAPP